MLKQLGKEELSAEISRRKIEAEFHVKFQMKNGLYGWYKPVRDSLHWEKTVEANKDVLNFRDSDAFRRADDRRREDSDFRLFSF